MEEDPPAAENQHNQQNQQNPENPENRAEDYMGESDQQIVDRLSETGFLLVVWYEMQFIVYLNVFKPAEALLQTTRRLFHTKKCFVDIVHVQFFILKLF